MLVVGAQVKDTNFGSTGPYIFGSSMTRAEGVEFAQETWQVGAVKTREIAKIQTKIWRNEGYNFRLGYIHISVVVSFAPLWSSTHTAVAAHTGSSIVRTCEGVRRATKEVGKVRPVANDVREVRCSHSRRAHGGRAMPRNVDTTSAAERVSGQPASCDTFTALQLYPVVK